MSGRNLLLSIINHEQTDRIPVSPFIHVNFVKAFHNNNATDLISATIDLYEKFGFDIIHRNCTPVYDYIGTENANWHIDKNVIQDNFGTIVYTRVNTPHGCLTEKYKSTQVSQYDIESSPVEYLVKTKDDFELLERFQPSVEKIDVESICKAKKLVDDKGLIAPWIQGAFNFVSIHYRKLDDLILDAMIDPAFYHKVMRYFLNRNIDIIDQYINAGTDILSYGGNIASGKLIGEYFFRKYIFDYEKQLIDHIQSRGVHVLYHNCGYAKNLFSCYRDLGMHMYESLTPPPYGDTLILDAFRKLGSDIVLCGGIDQIDYLRKASVDEIDRNIMELFDRIRQYPNYIMGTSDYFHEDTPVANIIAFSSAVKRYGNRN